MLEIALILLAAGGSARLGRPKQLLMLDGETLVHRAVRQAAASVCRPVVVVLGANDAAIEAEICDFPVRIVRNERWEAGMGGSIRRGIQAVEGICRAAVVMLCDQPWTTTVVIDRLVEMHLRTGKMICASAYAGAVGPPCLFGVGMFPKLLNLPDNCGAKRLLVGSPEELEQVPFAEGAMDIDTPADLEALMRQRGHLPR